MILAAAAALMAVASCNKEQNVPENPVGPEGKTVTINASIPEELTKVALGYTGSALDLTWSAGDQITVYDHSNKSNKQIFTLASGQGEKTATFTGTAVSASSYDIELISNMPSGAAILNQTQSADGSTAHLGYAATITGVSSYEDVTFSSSWATSKGGTFAQSGAIHVSVSLPTGVAAKVNKVTMSAGTIGSIVVNITNKGDEGADGKLDVFAILPAQINIPANTGILFKFEAPGTDHTVYTRYYESSSATTFAPGQLNRISLTGTNSDKYAGKLDDGTAAHPYLIADKYQMDAMHNLMVNNTTKYFKMVADVDLDGIAWTSLNNSDNFEKGINFDGDGHTISNLKCSSGAYPSFAGVINGVVKNVVFDKASITAGNNTSGILAGYIGSSGASVSGACSGVTVKNSSITEGTKKRVGGLAGIADKLSADIDDCHVINTTVTGLGGDNTDARVGGLLGELSQASVCKNSTAENVTVSGSKFIGVLIGYVNGTVENCWSSGSVSSPNKASNKDICMGGLVGYLENGTITKCHSSASVKQTINGRSIGGLVGYVKTAATIEKSYCSGEVSGIQRNVGGFLGCQLDGTVIISNCYTSSDVSANSYNGGFVGLHAAGTLTVKNCYASGNVSSGFAAGGFIGYATVAGLDISKSAAWNGEVSATSHGQTNWSSGAVIGVTHPNCVISNTFRNPNMALTVYCPPPTADWNHPDIDGNTHPLYQNSQTSPFTWAETTATSISAGTSNVDAGRWAYHGKVETGKTLSELASTTLGWSSEIWDFSTALPTLK